MAVAIKKLKPMTAVFGGETRLLVVFGRSAVSADAGSGTMSSSAAEKHAGIISIVRRKTYGFGDLHSDREQWLDDVGDLPAVHAVVHPQPCHCCAGGSLRLQL